MSIRARIVSKLVIVALGFTMAVTSYAALTEYRSNDMCQGPTTSGIPKDPPPRDCRPEECGVSGAQGPGQPSPRPSATSAS